MLVLERKVGEMIVIGPDVALVVLGVYGGGRVKLGIAAPAATHVLRRELLEPGDSRLLLGRSHRQGGQ